MNTGENQEKLVERLFNEAVQLAGDERLAFLEANCHDEAIRAQVEKLLRSDQAVGG